MMHDAQLPIDAEIKQLLFVGLLASFACTTLKQACMHTIIVIHSLTCHWGWDNSKQRTAIARVVKQLMKAR